MYNRKPSASSSLSPHSLKSVCFLNPAPLPRRRDLATQSPRLPSSASPSPRHHHVVAIQARRVAVVSLLCVVAIQARRVTVVSLRGLQGFLKQAVKQYDFPTVLANDELVFLVVI
nr:sporulation-specific protein 15 isoform X1 [Ipomoea batatas]